MAVVMMASNEKNNTTTNNKNPIFHDFLGTTSGGDSPSAAVWTKSREIHRAVEEEADVEAAEASASVGASSSGHALVLASSDLGSERQPMNNFEHFQFHGRGKDISEPELNNRFSGKKRSYSDSVFMGLTRERMLPAASDSFESSCLMKMFGKDVVSERPRRSRDDELMFAMQPPPRPNSTSIILNPPFSNKPDSVVSKWERSVPTIAGPMVHCASRFGQGGTCVDKYSSPHPYKDSSAGPALVSQAAADEGSRTGMKGTGILNVLKSCGVGERNSSEMLPCSSRQKVNPQSTAPESSNIPSHRSIATASRQMTIFYGGQAHVFDDVHPNKADVIMGLAGSNGGSWSTKFSPRPPIPEAKVPSVEKEMGTSSLAFSNDLNNRLSVQQNCNPGFDQVGRVPLVGDPKSSTSGGHLGVRNFTDTRPINQAAEPDTEGKKNI